MSLEPKSVTFINISYNTLVCCADTLLDRKIRKCKYNTATRDETHTTKNKWQRKASLLIHQSNQALSGEIIQVPTTIPANLKVCLNHNVTKLFLSACNFI